MWLEFKFSLCRFFLFFLYMFDDFHSHSVIQLTGEEVYVCRLYPAAYTSPQPLWFTWLCDVILSPLTAVPARESCWFVLACCGAMRLHMLCLSVSPPHFSPTLSHSSSSVSGSYLKDSFRISAGFIWRAWAAELRQPTICCVSEHKPWMGMCKYTHVPTSSTLNKPTESYKPV